MESNVVFRPMPIVPTPTEVRETLLEERSKEGKPVDEAITEKKVPPLSLYEHINKRPYSADYFGIAHMWERWNFPKELAAIEDFVKGEIKGQVLNDSVESYKEIVENLENKIGKRANERIWHKLDRIVTYINAIKNFRKWEAIKRKMEEFNG